MKNIRETQMVSKWRSRAVALMLLLGGSVSVMAQNTIQAVSSTQQGGSDVVRIELSEALGALPVGFAVQTPPRIAIDLPGVGNALGKSSVDVNQGNLRSINIAQSGERTRLVLNLKKAGNYRAELQGKVLLLTLDATAPPVVAESTVSAARPNAPATAEPVRFAESLNRNPLALRDVDFRRGSDGAGRVVVELANNQVGVDIRQQGQSLVVEFLRSTLPESLRRQLDVTDFGTPVQTITTSQVGDRVRMVVQPRGNWDHSAYQSDSQFVLEVRAQKVDPNKLTQGTGFAVGPSVKTVQTGSMSFLIGKYPKVWLGLIMEKNRADRKAVISDFSWDSPAPKSGLKTGDELVAVDGRDIRDPEGAKAIYFTAKAGDTVSVVIRRQGEQKELSMQYIDRFAKRN